MTIAKPAVSALWVLLTAVLVRSAEGANSRIPTDDLLATRVQSVLKSGVTKGTITGALVVASRGNRTIVSEAVGVYDAKTMTPLSASTVISLASMSKPVTATALLMLVDDGKVKLDDPVSHYIPAFDAPLYVRSSSSGAALPLAAEYNLAPARRSLTIRDLLTYTGGLATKGFSDPAVPAIGADETLASWTPKVAQMPVDYQPGSAWAYSPVIGYDVLSRVIEVASGKSFNDFIKERLLDPLEMHSTGFLGQRADLIARTPPVPPQLLRDPRISSKVFVSGSAGLYGTLDDYRHFLEMLANGGSWRGKRLLLPSTVNLMVTNQVGDLYQVFEGRAIKGMGFGLGVATIENQKAAALDIPKHSFGWIGAGGVRFWVCPVQHLVLVMYVPDPVITKLVQSMVLIGARPPDASVKGQGRSP
jgi:CubicO group peptidase (beta-lactamase class C family)